MPVWTYHVIEWGPDDTCEGERGAEGFERFLNAKGQERWELVSVLTLGDRHLLAILKMPRGES